MAASLPEAEVVSGKGEEGGGYDVRVGGSDVGAILDVSPQAKSDSFYKEILTRTDSTSPPACTYGCTLEPLAADMYMKPPVSDNNNEGAAHPVVIDDADWLRGDRAREDLAAYKLICKQDVARDVAAAYPTAVSVQNRGKNRYGGVGGVYPEEKTRVPAWPDGYGYINANFVWGLAEPERRFIATQAPIPSTIGDFWRMCSERRVPVVVMLTRLVENARQKAHLYWPVADSHSRVWDGMRVTRLAFYEEGGLQIQKLMLESQYQGPFGPKHVVHHINYTDWPDFHVPNSTLGIRKAMTLMKRFRRDAMIEDKGPVGPTVVHCSAGVGRSGTFIGASLLDEELAKGVPLYDLKVPETVVAMRTQRVGCVQTIEQFLFLRRLLLDRALYWTRVCAMGPVDVDQGCSKTDEDSFPEDDSGETAPTTRGCLHASRVPPLDVLL